MGEKTSLSSYLICKGSKHEWCSLIFISFVHSKHHDQVFDDSWMLSYGHCHVEGVRVIMRADTKRERRRWGEVNIHSSKKETMRLLFKSMHTGDGLLQGSAGVTDCFKVLTASSHLTEITLAAFTDTISTTITGYPYRLFSLSLHYFLSCSL